MKNAFAVATIFIAGYALSTGAWSQKVYKCGSSYSQTPCADGTAIDVKDERSKDDKAAADQATKRDMKVANDMEKARLKEEKEAMSAGGNKERGHAETKTKSAGKAAAKDPDQTTLGPKKKHKGKAKDPEFFTAKSAAEKK
jgi:hypothetical protein